MNYITVLKTGGEFKADHENRIRQHLRSATHGHAKSVCLTDDAAVAPWTFGAFVHEVRPLELGLPGWWSMLEMFRIPGPALYLDLDMLVRGDLGDVVKTVEALDEDEVLMIRPWGEAERKRGAMLSGVMAWSGDMRWLWHDLAAAYHAGDVAFLPRASSVLTRDGHMQYRGTRYRNDQDWIVAQLQANDYTIRAWQDVMPDAIQSYKRELDSDISNATAPIVAFHGKPRPWDVGL